ncbi:MAG: hypothetical protein ACRCYO_19135 [Bacteroidia bacterium]
MLTAETRTTHITYDPQRKIVFMVAKPQAHFDAEHAWENRNAAIALCPGEKCCLVFETERDITTTSEMRAASASPLYNEFYSAVALVSPSIAMKLMGNFYLRINNPVVPTRFFSTRESAVFWLGKQVEMLKLKTA